MATANPAVVIGLGGTGQWVVTYLKKNLIDTYGEVPPTVKLLAFDTTSDKSEAEIETQPGEEQARVGNVTLDSGEFVYLGGNIRRICQEIVRENKHPHIASWLQAAYYLNAHDDDAYDISKGAGRRRQFGRMAIFYDLATGGSKIWGKIEQALVDVKGAQKKSVPVEIYVVCSLAGGTGAGMFIDVAHLARVIANKIDVQCAVRGFLVLQNTFSPVARIDDVQPSAFAAMRELERLMLVINRNYPIYYTSDSRRKGYQTIYNSKLFDNCYFLDARRTNKPLDNYAPKLGVFPSVAECMTVLLDPETGNTFEQHYKNVNDRLAKAQVQEGKALYSSLGTYTYILPVRDIIQRNTLKLALELIEKRLAAIQRDPDTNILRVASNQVVEFKTPPRQEAQEFLQAEKSSSNVQNLQFNQNVSWAMTQPLDQPHIIENMANLGIELVSWLQPVEQDDEVLQAGERISNVLQTSLIESVPNSKQIGGEDFQSGADRIERDIQSIRQKLLGSEEQSGRVEPGELQRGLADYTERNIKRFRRLLAEKITLLLNGITDDPVVAKTGKLPYAQEFLHWLIKSYETFEQFMQQTISQRAKSGALAQAREFRVQTRQYMRDSVHATGIVAKLRGEAVKAQDSYIETEDYLFGLQREELLYQTLLTMTRDFKKITQEIKKEVDEWIAYLALGSAPESGEIGVYRALLERWANLKRRRDQQERLEVYRYLTDESYEDDLYAARITHERLGEILRHFTWRLADGEEFNLRLFYAVPRRGQSLDEAPELFKEARRRNQKATDLNVQALLKHLEPYFLDIRNETVADRMEEAMTADRTAKELLESSGALIAYAENDQPLAEKHNFVCANPGTQITYFNQLEKALQKSAPHDKDNQVAGLTNRHRCIILSTIDLIIGQEIDPYTIAADKYKNFNGDHRLLHNFPAEVNATKLEEDLPKPPIREAYRLLSPHLVALMEDTEMVNRFFMALVYGMIREEAELTTDGHQTSSRNTQYILRLDTRSARERRVESWQVRLTPPDSNPSLFDAMTNFVFTHLDDGKWKIKDVSPEENILVDPSQVDRAISLRQNTVMNGLEAVVEAFFKMLGEPAVSNLLQPGGDVTLASAFRQLLVEYERALRRGDMDTVYQALADLVDENEDCYETQYREDLVQHFRTFIERYRNGENIEPGGAKALIKKLEDFIDDKVQLLRGKRRPDLRRGEREPEDQLTRDLGSIMYRVLWDEVERLERLSN